jgi:hypothetical protein
MLNLIPDKLPMRLGRLWYWLVVSKITEPDTLVPDAYPYQKLVLVSRPHVSFGPSGDFIPVLLYVSVTNARG